MFEQELLVSIQFGIAAHDQGAAISRWKMHVEHLHSGKFVEHSSWRGARRQRLEPCPQRDVEAIGEKCDKDMRLSGLRLHGRAEYAGDHGNVLEHPDRRSSTWQARHVLGIT